MFICRSHILYPTCLPVFKPFVSQRPEIEWEMLCFRLHPSFAPASSTTLSLPCFYPISSLFLPCTVCTRHLLLPLALGSETGSHLAASQSQIHQRAFLFSSLLSSFCLPHFLFRFSFLFAFLLPIGFFVFTSQTSGWLLPFFITTSTRVRCACSFSISLYGVKSFGQA